MKARVHVAVAGLAMTVGLVMPMGVAQALTPAKATPSTVIPHSSNGCNGYVCININGNGTHVNYIATTVQNPSKKVLTSRGHVYVNGRPVHSFGSHRLRGYPAKEQYTWNSPHYRFKKHQKVCIQWSGISGFPCETIG
jgi:hypothetical protein